MTMRKYSACLALGFGPVLLLQTVLRHWGQWSGWVVADLAAAILLALSGARVLTKESTSVCWLAGAWGFATGTLWVSLFTLIPNWSDAGDPREGQAGWLVMAGWLLITAITGFAGSLSWNQNARR